MITPTTTSPLAQRAKFVLQRIQALNTEGLAQMSAIIAGIRTLVETIGRPLLRVRPLCPDDLPFKNDYEAMAEELQADLTSTSDTLPQLANTGVLLHNYAATTLTATGEVVATVEQLTAELEHQQSVQVRGHLPGIGPTARVQASAVQAFTETFASDAHIDWGQSRGVDWLPETQLVSLHREDDTNLAGDCSVHIPVVLDGQRVIGLPGNTSEVVVPMSAQWSGVAPSVRYLGESDPHGDPQALIDGDAQSWYEFERCVLDGPQQPVVGIGDALMYSGGGQVVDVMRAILPDTWQVTVEQDGQVVTTPQLASPPSGTLPLTIDLVLPTPRLVSAVTVDPYLPEKGASAPPILASVVAITPANEEILVYQRGMYGLPGKLTKRQLFSLPKPQRIARIRYSFVQPTPYRTLIGHTFYVATLQHSKSKSFLGFSLGAKQWTTRQRVASPAAAYALNTGKSSGWAILFSSQRSTQVVNTASGIDVFRAKRWQVGLRELGLYRTTYTASGQLTSTPYTFRRKVAGVRVVARGAAPEGATITYEVSPDGSAWLPIRGDGSECLLFATPTADVRVRCSLARRDIDPDDAALTPLMFGYDLHGVFAA